MELPVLNLSWNGASEATVSSLRLVLGWCSGSDLNICLRGNCLIFPSSHRHSLWGEPWTAAGNYKLNKKRCGILVRASDWNKNTRRDSREGLKKDPNEIRSSVLMCHQPDATVLFFYFITSILSFQRGEKVKRSPSPIILLSVMSCPLWPEHRSGQRKYFNNLN